MESEKIMCYDKVFNAEERKGVVITITPSRVPQWFTEKAYYIRSIGSVSPAS
jgi:hypothetical protein